ncbi:MAG: phenylacetate--CoA ligase family protein, partial [Thermodesulfobacteriota bacterium]|nr:phenylacetate--CoA ligase family protein [Thermodesulfobacteriota bacterium]
PRIRFGSGDLGTLIDEPCPCGRTSYRLPKILGRVGEAVKIRGMFVHPMEVDDVVSKIPEISKYKIDVTHENRKDIITVKLELNQEDADKDKIRETFMKDFQNRCRVRVNTVEFISKGSIPEDAKKIDDLRKEILL